MMAAPFSDKYDIEVVVDALKDATIYNETLVESERVPGASIRSQPPEVREAMRKIKLYERLLGRFGRRRLDGRG